jgi:raffinose/stachyose/melibiose transport system permease protein
MRKRIISDKPSKPLWMYIVLILVSFVQFFPMVKPAIVTITVITFINNWNEFIMAFTYTSKTAFRTLPFFVYEFAGVYSASYATQFAVMALSSLPTLLVYDFLNEQITKGITMGALK